MNETELMEFKEAVASQVNAIVAAQHKANTDAWYKFNADLTYRLEVVLPRVMEEISPKDDRLFRADIAITNGLIIGASVLLAAWIYGA